MKITQPGQARLQVAIREWMRNEVPEAAQLFSPERVPVKDIAVTADLVAMKAADAAYAAVINMVEMLGLDQEGR